MKKLDFTTFRRTIGGDRMDRVKINEGPPFDFWPYVEEIPTSDYRGYAFSDGRVEWVWRSQDGRFEHVLISAAEDEDTFMAVVLDRINMVVVGHRLLDLKAEYGISQSVPRRPNMSSEQNPAEDGHGKRE